MQLELAQTFLPPWAPHQILLLSGNWNKESEQHLQNITLQIKVQWDKREWICI